MSFIWRFHYHLPHTQPHPQIGIGFSQHSESTGAETPLLNFDLRSLSAEVEQTTWVLRVGVALSSLAVEDHHTPTRGGGGGDTMPTTTPPRMLLTAGDEELNEKFLDFTYRKVKGHAWVGVARLWVWQGSFKPFPPPPRMKFQPLNITLSLAPPSKP